VRALNPERSFARLKRLVKDLTRKKRLLGRDAAAEFSEESLFFSLCAATENPTGLRARAGFE